MAPGRRAAALRCAQAARAATAAPGLGPGAEAMQDAAAQPDPAHLPRQQNLQADGFAQLPRQQLLHSGEAAASAQELVHSWQSSAMAGDAARKQEGEGDAKLGKRVASLSILASGCSETAEAPAAPADAGVCTRLPELHCCHGLLTLTQTCQSCDSVTHV